jgi:hypothetical protein
MIILSKIPGSPAKLKLNKIYTKRIRLNLSLTENIRPEVYNWRRLQTGVPMALNLLGTGPASGFADWRAASR